MNNNVPTGGGTIRSLTYLFSHEGGRTIAHCLDLDIATSGSSIEDAEASLDALVVVQIGQNFAAGNFSQLRFKAPFEYWEELNDAARLENRHIKIEVPEAVLPVSSFCLPILRSELTAAAA
jgi:hypothetical protein